MRRRQLLLLLALFISVAVCLAVFWQRFHELSRNEEENFAAYDRHYVMITEDGDSDLWDQEYESALEEGKAQGVYVERFGKNLSVEYGRNELLKFAIQASVDGIIVSGDEDERTVALLNEAAGKGIPVVTVLQDSPGSLRQCFVGNNSYHLGQEYAGQIMALLDENKDNLAADRDAGHPVKTLVLMDADRQDSSQMLTTLGIRETLERKLEGRIPVSVETRKVDNSRSFSSEEYIRDIFLSREELPDILICLSAVHTRCAYQAAVDYNKVGSMQILGYYDSDAVLDAVAKGIVCSTITIDTTQMGKQCIDALEEYIKTGYTNNYRAVDTRLITSKEAEALLAQEE